MFQPPIARARNMLKFKRPLKDLLENQDKVSSWSENGFITNLSPRALENTGGDVTVFLFESYFVWIISAHSR